MENKKTTIEFDIIGSKYDDMVKKALSIESSHEYFESYKVMHLKNIMKKIGHKSEKFRILDYGCGVGLLSAQLMKECENITIDGFDVSAESIAYIPDFLKKQPECIFTSNLTDLSNEYDMAILSVVLHHVAIDERPEIINNIYSKLRWGGGLAIIEHNLQNPLTKKTVDHCEFDKNAVMLNINETEQLMKGAGFKSINSKYITFFPEQLKKFRSFDIFLGWLPLGAQFMITGYK